MARNNFTKYFVRKDKKVFFPMFEQAAHNVVAMATILVEAVNSSNPGTREGLIKQIDKLENKGDDITHSLHLELGKNFVADFDRQDIHSLASAIDDVADNIHDAANRMGLYGIDDFTPPIIKLSELILQAATELEKAVKELKNLKNRRNIADSCIRINTTESQADHVFDHAVAELFLYEKDAIRIIKYKDILSCLELATDKCEDAANIMESILVKNG